jgi:hypothetical protein
MRIWYILDEHKVYTRVNNNNAAKFNWDPGCQKARNYEKDRKTGRQKCCAAKSAPTMNDDQHFHRSPGECIALMTGWHRFTILSSNLQIYTPRARFPRFPLMLKKRPVRILSTLTRRFFLPKIKKISPITEDFPPIVLSARQFIHPFKAPIRHVSL